MNFYKSGRIYYKVRLNSKEKIYAYWHCFGIENSNGADCDEHEMQVITEAQYNRAKRLILKKLQNV